MLIPGSGLVIKDNGWFVPGKEGTLTCTDRPVCIDEVVEEQVQAVLP